MVTRALIVAVCLLVGAAYLGLATKTEAVPLRESLASVPMQIGGWQGQPAPDLEANIVAILGVDEYVNRLYSRSRQAEVGLYIGYYESQRQGDAIHSPLNCLPGAGWEPVKGGRITIPVANDLSRASGEMRSIEVNRYVIEKGLDRMVVLYWYQSHGRIVASEYWGKIYMVVDAIRMNRTDGALVRVISPVVDSDDAAAEETADRLAIDFVKSMFPLLGRYLPA